ncbi:MAG: type II toxin-antitoxin system HicA family toxin [Planctomycetes bacterium]|jgi:predicted RNA binding protein YcfA (HicA-like mRNA interferase family)|nr:type II toxin-antitoxin system HicA family toxin [Planctomycetota bacterium]
MASEMRYSEVKKMLEAKGYRLDHVTGSHHVFKKPGARTFPIPVHNGKVGPAYVRVIKKLEP